MTQKPPAQSVSDMPRTHSGAPYIRNETAIVEIVDHSRSGHYCTVLGPPYCQKSLLLRDVKERLEATGDELCVYLNLQGVPCAADEDFLPAFGATLAEQLRQGDHAVSSSATASLDSERDLQRYLQERVVQSRRDVVLLLDHLERVRPAPMKALLRVLRAIFNERSADAPCRLGVVTANSLTTASLALGKTSPFNIAHIIWVKDLTPEESQQLIAWLCMASTPQAVLEARQRIIDATNGDRELLQILFDRCATLHSDDMARLITKDDAERTIVSFVESEAKKHPSFQEMTRTIEADPDTLLNVLNILERGGVPRNELALDLMADVDDLRLTGAVRLESDGAHQIYRIRNEIYERFLGRHLNPDRVADVLSIAGRWRQAVPHLERLESSQGEHRLTLLSTMINAIYTANSVEEACAGLARAMSRAFAIPGLRLYLATPERSRLRLVSHFGQPENWPPDISLTERSTPEARAFISEDYHVSRDAAGNPMLLIPLRQEDQPPLGLVAAHGLATDPHNEGLLEFLAALGPIGRAIGSVIERENKLRQLTVLHQTGQEVTVSLDLEQVLESTLDAALLAVPAAQKASLFVWDEVKQKLIIKKHKGFQDSIVDLVQLDVDEGGAGWVYQHRVPLLLADALASTRPRMTHTEHPDNKDLKSTILVPLEAWGRVIGVLCLDNVTAYDAFRQGDLELLSTLGAQAAIAIQNANVHTELYTLGININRGTLTSRRIFEQTVQSITRVTGASGANMLLLQDTDNPELCLSQKPTLAVNSPNFGPKFQNDIRPRPGGLTHKVLLARRPLWVSNLNEPPGINPTARTCGTQSYLCLPLMIQEAIIGVLFVHYDAPHVFSSDKSRKRNEISDEIKMISLFGNQAALAIENAKQRKDLEIVDALAWMGIAFSSLAHRITQRAGAILNTAYGLQNLTTDPIVKAGLDEIKTYANQVQEIPRGALLPVREQDRSIDVAAFLRETVPQWCPPGIEIDFGDCPSDTAMILADRGRIQMLLEILTTNAVRAMTQSDPPRKLTVRTRVHAGEVAVEMTNTGREMPPAIRSLLFLEPIPKTSGAEGTGVGLLIARTIVRRYGGDIALVQSDAMGTTFSFSLPLYSVPIPKH